MEASNIPSPNQPCQNRNDPQEELIQLRIRAAVLENELNIKAREAVETERSMVLIAKALAAHAPNISWDPTSEGATKSSDHLQAGHRGGYTAAQHELVKQLEVEIEDLRRENRAFREKLKNARQTEILPPVTPQLQPYDERPRNRLTSIKSSTFSTPDASYEDTLPSSSAPISPLFPADYSAGVANVGIEALDDVLGPEDLAMPDMPSPSSGLGAGGYGREEESMVVQESLDTMPRVQADSVDGAALHKSQNAPAPTVLKTGFELNNNYRGRVYDGKDNKTIPRNEVVPQPGLAKSMWAPGNDNPSSRTMVRKSNDRRPQGMTDEARFADPHDFRRLNIVKYGIAYTPAKEDSNYFRTVHITNLPKGIHLRDVLARVRGGQIISAVIADTTPITGSVTVIIEFVQETAANDYVDFAAIHPITFGDNDDDKVTATVTLIQTPAYPLTQGEKNILYNHGQTRCFSVRNFPTHLPVGILQNNIQCKARSRIESILDTYFDERRNLHLEFASLVGVDIARVVLADTVAYRGLEVQSERDPCAGPVEELLLDTPMRRPFIPKSGFLSHRGPQLGMGDRKTELVVSGGGELVPDPAKDNFNPDEIILDTESIA